MWTRFIDAHLHLHDQRLASQLIPVLTKANIAGVCRLFCNACHESEWPDILELSARYSWIIPFLGIHPWNAETVEPGWSGRLHDALLKLKNGAGIGETGLDKACNVDFKMQKQLFIEHLDIAKDLGLPISIHCVRSWGVLIDILEKRAAENRLPSTMIHSFNGSMEIMQRLVDIGCFLSYSSWIADPAQVKIREVFNKTPIEYLLLETDSPDQLNTIITEQEDLITEYNEPMVVAAIYRSAAQQRKIHIEDLAAQLWQNASVYAYKAIIR